jgi:hypothetical protein
MKSRLFAAMFCGLAMSTAAIASLHDPSPAIEMDIITDTTPEAEQLCDFAAIIKRMDNSATIDGLLISDDELWHCEQQIINTLRGSAQ